MSPPFIWIIFDHLGAPARTALSEAAASDYCSRMRDYTFSCYTLAQVAQQPTLGAAPCRSDHTPSSAAD